MKDQFYSGNSCIYSQLRMKCNSAMNMQTISDSYGGSDLENATENLRSSRNALLALMESDAGASALYDANQELQSVAVLYYHLLSSRDDITAEDLGYLESDFHTFLNAERVIGDSSYNDEVRHFDRNVLGFFPLSILKAFIETPESFS